MKVTSYKEKYEAKKYAYDNLSKDYNELVENYNSFKEVVIKALENYKGDGDNDYDVGYNIAIEHAIAVVADINVPLIFEAENPPFLLTRLEYELIKHWGKKYKYIARDEEGSLYVYKDIPSKNEDVWGTLYGHAKTERDFDDFFKFVEWSDKEPTNIEELLNNCEVVEND